MLRYHPTLANATSLWRKMPLSKPASLGSIYLTDIVVTQGPGPFTLKSDPNANGEFYGLFYIPRHRYGKILKESDQELLVRITRHIEQIISATLVKHLDENFVAGQLKPERVNHVTRVIFPEFYFFPLRERGPIGLAAFSDFMQQLKIRACQLPENYHLVLVQIAPVIMQDIPKYVNQSRINY